MVSSRSSSHKRFSLGSHLERTALTLELVRLACGFLPNLLFRRVYHVRVWGRRWVVAQVFVTSLRVRLLLVLLVLPTARPLCCVYACVCACLRVCVIFTIGLWCEEDWLARFLALYFSLLLLLLLPHPPDVSNACLHYA